MEFIHKTNDNYATDYIKIKQALMHDPVIRQKVKDPIKEWQTWIDLDNESLRDLTSYLLSELVFTEPLTSITKIIPLVENNDLMVSLSMYMDKECIYATHTPKHDYSPLFISTNDLVNVLAELIKESDHEYHESYAYHKFAWKLGIIHDLEDKLKEK